MQHAANVARRVSYANGYSCSVRRAPFEAFVFRVPRVSSHHCALLASTLMDREMLIFACAAWLQPQQLEPPTKQVTLPLVGLERGHLWRGCDVAWHGIRR